MKLIKWILSHGVLVVIVALVALGIYFRTDLFPEYFAQREPAVAPAVTSQPQTQPAPEAQPVSEPSSGAGIAVTVTEHLYAVQTDIGERGVWPIKSFF